MCEPSKRYRCEPCDVTVTLHAEEDWCPICTCGEEMVRVNRNTCRDSGNGYLVSDVIPERLRYLDRMMREVPCG